MKYFTISFTCLIIVISVKSFPQQAGDLDQSFGTNGIVITDLDSMDRDECVAVTMHPFGHIYAAGGTGQTDFSPLWAWMSLIKYNYDGSVDNTFGDNGRVFEYTSGKQTYCTDVEFYGNNQSVVMTGWNWDPFNNTQDLLVYRYDQFGQRDNLFGNNGEVSLFAGSNDQARKIAVQYDSKILVGGLTAIQTGTTDYLLLRLNNDGSLDNSFSNDGIIIGDISNSSDYLSNLLFLPDSKILIVVHTQTTTNVVEQRIIRFHPDGSLDNSFGNNGTLLTDFRFLNSIAVTVNGKILASGADLLSQGYLRRYNEDGSIDASFNNGDPLNTSIWLSKLAVQFDGKIVGVGSEYQMGFLIQRFNEDGTFDNSFGINGSASANLTTAQDLAYDLFLQNDRKILAVGVAWQDSLNRDFGLARLLSNPITPNTPVQIGDGLGNLSYYNFANLGLPAVEQVTAVPFPNTLPPNLPGDSPLASSVVNRYYDLRVSPENAGSSSNYSATLRLYYSDDEVIAIDESKLKLIRYNGSGWDYVGGTVNTAENYVEAAGITRFNIFAFADPDSITLDAEEEMNSVNDFRLEQNYPNPFNPTTKIEYSIPSESFVELKVYDVLGKEVATLVNEQQQAGVYRADFTADNLPSGIYFARITANEFTQIVKMTLLK